METINDICSLYSCKTSFPAQDFYLKDVISFTINCLDINDVKVKNNISIIVEEAFVNISHYSGSSFADVTIYKNDDFGYLLLEDNGKPFNPLEKEENPYSQEDSATRIGGLGILLIKEMSQGVYYEYKDNKNRLLIKLARCWLWKLSNQKTEKNLL